jgi:hypothetical protein
MAPVRAALGVVVVLLAFLGGVWIGLGAGDRGGIDATVGEPLRPSETPGPPETVESGAVSYRVVGWRCGLQAVQGDHADWLPDGQYCRVRLRMTSADRYVHVFRAEAQTLVTADGDLHPANLNAMQISDQPTRTEARPGAVLEFDVWFDIPRDATAVALQLFGEEDTQGARVTLAGQ